MRGLRPSLNRGRVVVAVVVVEKRKNAFAQFSPAYLTLFQPPSFSAMIQDALIHSHLVIHFFTSSGVSERVSERMSAVERASEASSAK